ncbi:hypothetical protein [Massilia sp. Root335]|jgi:hypothetical protein|uniref:hypothetical protein n=1 Tax=Massilia sp. Root335 TaxID=1736517 RepID=UPI0006FA473A|nr:hypothetical protein [Massilia sp. Root335]KQV50057.1 hypothetical protein ASC93_11085 [Massilia sp. Root335]
MSTTRAALVEILEGVEAIDVDEGAKDKFRQLVGAVANTHGYDWIERASRIDFARGLLRMRVSRPEVRDRLIALYGISRPQAYRIISHALQLSHE